MALTAPHKQTAHHKKSRGEHHNRNKHYFKAYHPYLPLLLLVIVGIAVNTYWTSQARVLGAATNMVSSQLVSDTNSQRSRRDESSLKLNQQLSAAAQAKANDMVNRDYWSHAAPDGSSPWSFVQKSGYQYQSAGENLAYGFMDAKTTVNGWMNSPEHRANILNSSYSEVGFGIATAKDYQHKGPMTIVVALYGQPVTSDDNLAVSSASNFASAATSQPYRTVSRVQLLTNGWAPWSLIAVTAFICIAGCIVLSRHAKAWHRLLVGGEAFVLRHKVLDIVLVSLIIAGIILTRSSGFIG